MRLRLRRGIFVALGVVAVTLILIWGRAFWGSVENYRIGEECFKTHDHIKAITFFDRALHWYTPFNPYVARSVQRLWEIGLHAEQEGDIRLALIAFRTIRQGFYAARSFYTPGKEWIGRCDAKIASLMAVDPAGQQSEHKGHALPTGEQRSETDVFWTFVLEAGLLGWIGSAIGFLMCGIAEGETPALRSKPALLWGIAVLVFYALWIVGMTKA